ncbi:hypothetical protein BKA66DRAFT_434558, partial [Pyrenochaeta sp. MPI-SDFR-AT-0127]
LVVIRNAAIKGKAKLSKYYRVISRERGFLFNYTTILDPTQKLTAYKVLLITVYYHSHTLTTIYRTKPRTHLISSLIANNSSNTSNDIIIESILLSPY